MCEHGDRLENLINEALLCQQQSRIADAIQNYTAVLSLEPDHEESIRCLASLSLESGDWQAALSYLDRLVLLNPSDFEARVNQAELLKRIGDIEQSYKNYQALAREYPGEPIVLFNMALVEQSERRLEDAITHLIAAVTARPEWYDALFRLANLYHRTEQYESAIEYYQRCLTVRSEWQVYYNLALVFIQTGDIQSVENTVSQGIAKVSSTTDLTGDIETLATLLDKKADSFIPLQRYDDAVSYGRSALAIYQQVRQAYCPYLGGKLCNLLVDLGRFKESISIYQYALQLGYESVDLLNDYGRVLLLLDYNDKAEQVFRRALSIDRRNSNILANYAYLLASEERYDESIEFCERAIDCSEEKSKHYRNLANIYFLSGRLRQGLSALEQRESSNALSLPLPDWSARNNKLLVVREQGLGDEMRYASFLQYLFSEHDLCCCVMCDERLVSLFARSFPKLEVVGATGLRQDQALQDSFNCEIRSVSLGLRYLAEITASVNDFRQGINQTPAYSGHLIADADRVIYYRGICQSRPGKIKIGFCWRSAVNILRHRLRYPELSLFESLFKSRDITLVNLQHQPTDDEVSMIHSWLGAERYLKIDNFNLKDDQDELAALISSLDLVISPSTTMFELASSVGVPTWVYKTKTDVDWTFAESFIRVFYHQLKVFSKKGYEEWHVVINDMEQELTQLLSE